MSIARSRSPFTYLYALCGQVLSSVPEARYLGIMVTDELSLSSHVQSIYSKANSTLGFLRHNLRLKESAYISLVRSTLEYAASVWDSHLAKDINKLENCRGDRQDLLKVTIARLPVSRRCCRSSAGRICRDVVGI